MSTKPYVIIIVLVSLSLAMFGAGFATFLLIREHADPGLIAVMSGFAGTALGTLASTLNNTRTSGGEAVPVVPVNTAANPLHTTEQ